MNEEIKVLKEYIEKGRLSSYYWGEWLLHPSLLVLYETWDEDYSD